MTARLALSLLALAGCDKLFLGKEPIDAIDDIATTPFGPPMPLPGINTPLEEDRGTLTDDLLELHFHRGLGLMVATRQSTSDEFGPPQMIAELQTGYQSNRGCISGDGLRIYFSRKATSALDEYDIFVSTRPNRTSTWATPTRVDDLSKTPVTEFCGWENAERTLMFTSSNFLGSPDIWRATRGDSAQPYVSQLLMDVSSGEEEGPAWANEDGRILVFERRNAQANERRLFQAVLQGATYTVRQLAELDVQGQDEGSPWLSPDARMIVFSVNNDLFFATR